MCFSISSWEQVDDSVMVILNQLISQLAQAAGAKLSKYSTLVPTQ